MAHFSHIPLFAHARAVDPVNAIEVSHVQTMTLLPSQSSQLCLQPVSLPATERAHEYSQSATTLTVHHAARNPRLKKTAKAAKALHRAA